MDEERRLTKGDRTRRALLTAATERFSRDGFRATSIADISRDAQVGPTTAYAHYRNKETLFLAAVDADLNSLFDEVIPLLEHVSEGTDESIIPILFGGLIEIVDEHPLARRLLAGLEPGITERVMANDVFGPLRDHIVATIATDRTDQRRPDIDPVDFADGMISIVVSVLMTTIQIGPVVLEERGAGIAAVFQALTTPDPRLGG